ncbi:MAG: hypothetical protein U9R22_02960 [Pseudomonadota bacterium]|nr:hypothetical protein [Pseudomonadota bacterium]
MDTVTLRAAIADALDHEQRTGELAYLLHGRLHRLHCTIQVNARDPTANLLAFVRDYVQRVPDLLDALRDIAEPQGNGEDVEAIIDRCVEFFASPPRLVVGHHGLNGAMNTAYMAHRLIEEMNDHHLVSRGRALAPIDTTRSNLIIHQLIGESYANQLDDAVHLIATELIHGWRGDRAPTASPAGKPEPLPELLRRWPCLKDSLGSDLLHLPAYGATSIH